GGTRARGRREGVWIAGVWMMVGSARYGGGSCRSSSGRRGALPRAPAPPAATDRPADAATARPVRRGHGWAPARLGQRPGAGALPNPLEPLRLLRLEAARPPPLPA